MRNLLLCSPAHARVTQKTHMCTQRHACVCVCGSTLKIKPQAARSRIRENPTFSFAAFKSNLRLGHGTMASRKHWKSASSTRQISPSLTPAVYAKKTCKHMHLVLSAVMDLFVHKIPARRERPRTRTRECHPFANGPLCVFFFLAILSVAPVRPCSLRFRFRSLLRAALHFKTRQENDLNRLPEDGEK